MAKIFKDFVGKLSFYSYNGETESTTRDRWFLPNAPFSTNRQGFRIVYYLNRNNVRTETGSQIIKRKILRYDITNENVWVYYWIWDNLKRILSVYSPIDTKLHIYFWKKFVQNRCLCFIFSFRLFHKVWRRLSMAVLMKLGYWYLHVGYIYRGGHTRIKIRFSFYIEYTVT